jgi:hypothetical protein
MVLKVLLILVLSFVVAIAQILVVNPLLGTFTQAIVDEDGESILHSALTAMVAMAVVASGIIAIQYLGQLVGACDFAVSNEWECGSM